MGRPLPSELVDNVSIFKSPTKACRVALGFVCSCVALHPLIARFGARDIAVSDFECRFAGWWCDEGAWIDVRIAVFPFFLAPFFFGECNYHISASGHGALEIPNPFKLTKNWFCIREISEEYDMWIDFERMHWSVTLLFFFSSIEFSILDTNVLLCEFSNPKQLAGIVAIHFQECNFHVNVGHKCNVCSTTVLCTT